MIDKLLFLLYKIWFYIESFCYMSFVPWPGFGLSVPRKTEIKFDSTVTLLTNGTGISYFNEKYHVLERYISILFIFYKKNTCP